MKHSYPAYHLATVKPVGTKALAHSHKPQTLLAICLHWAGCSQLLACHVMHAIRGNNHPSSASLLLRYDAARTFLADDLLLVVWPRKEDCDASFSLPLRCFFHFQVPLTTPTLYPSQPARPSASSWRAKPRVTTPAVDPSVPPMLCHAMP